MKTQIVDWLLDKMDAQYTGLDSIIPEVIEELKEEAKENESVGKTPKSFLKKCVNCGKEIPLASETCPFCGRRS